MRVPIQKKIFTLFVLGIVIHSLLSAQTVSPLFQVMSSNSLINRSQVFRDLQQSIKDVHGTTKPGINLEYFYEKMSAVRESILAKIQAPVLQYKKDSVLAFYRTDYLGGIRVEQVKRLIDVLNHTEEKLENVLSKEIKVALVSLSDDEKSAVIEALLVSLKTSGFVKDVNFGSTQDDRIGHLSNAIAMAVIDEIKKRIQQSSPKIKLFFDYTDKDKEEALSDLVAAVNNISDDVAENIRDFVTQALDNAEHEVAKVVNDINDWLLAGNIGLGVTKGSGAFAGGINFSFVGSTYQIGIYVNGQFNKNDSDKSPASSLLGFQARYAEDRWQLDGLASKLIGANQQENFEYGFGASYRANNDIVVGVAYFGLFESPDGGQLHTIQSTYGFVFKGTAAVSPALLLGGMRTCDETRPIFQISFPINAAQ
jgi:hypothetical protein